MKGFRDSPLGLRDGSLAQMAAEDDRHTRSHQQLESDRWDVLLHTSQSYRVDQQHADHVRQLALSLFDQTRSMHRLEKGFREWISAPAILHEVGTYVNPASPQRHTHYH